MRGKSNSEVFARDGERRIEVAYLSVSLLLNMVMLAGVVAVSIERSRDGGSRPGVPTQTNYFQVTNTPPLPAIEAKRVLAHWVDLESEFFEELIGNLESVGCPPRLIQSVVAADLDRLYQGKFHALKNPTNFWSAAHQRRRESRECRLRIREVLEEKRRILEELLGVDWSLIPDKEWEDEHAAFSSTLFGFADPERMENAMALVRKAERYREEADLEYDSFSSQEREQAISQSYRDLRNELSAVLTPEELEEYEVTMYAAILFDVWGPEARFGAKLKPEVLRDVLGILKPDNMFSHFGDGFLSSMPEVTVRQEVALRALLGDEVFGNYLRFKDPAFERHPSTPKEQLPTGQVMTEIYDIQRLVDAEKARIMAVSRIDAVAREVALREVQLETERAVADLLGAPMWDVYRERSGAWIQSIVESD